MRIAIGAYAPVERLPTGISIRLAHSIETSTESSVICGGNVGSERDERGGQFLLSSLSTSGRKDER